MVMPSPASTLSRLKAMLGESRFGITADSLSFSASREQLARDGWRSRRGVALYGFSLPLQPRRLLLQQFACALILRSRGIVESCRSWSATAMHTLGSMPKRRTSARRQWSLVDLLCRRIEIHMGIADEQRVFLSIRMSSPPAPMPPSRRPITSRT